MPRITGCLKRHSAARYCPAAVDRQRELPQDRGLLRAGRWFPDCTVYGDPNMSTGPPLQTFTVAEPYDVALRMVRSALARQGLRAPTELDIKARIRKELGAGVAPCMVLYIDEPAALLEAVVFNRGAALVIPQPLVISGGARQTKVLMRSLDVLTSEIPESARDPLRDLLRRMTCAMESIAESAPAETPPLSSCQCPVFP